MRLVPLVLMGLGLVAQAETLTLKAPGDVQMTMRDASGASRTCTVSQVDIIGKLSPIRVATVASIVVNGTGCATPVVVPPAISNASWGATNYIARTASTYVTAQRTGTGSLSVQWTATGGAIPASGTLYWAAGDTAQKFIKLALPAAPATVRLSLPGSVATVTVQ